MTQIFPSVQLTSDLSLYRVSIDVSAVYGPLGSPPIYTLTFTSAWKQKSFWALSKREREWEVELWNSSFLSAIS